MGRLKFIALLCFLLHVSIAAFAQSLYVGEFNIRNTNAKDAAAGDGWERRCPVVCDILKVEAFDVFGMQEVLHSQLEDVCAALPQYACIGGGRNDGKTAGEYSPICYRTERIKCLDSGMFWLSETPEVVGSKGWDAKYPRICTWGHFKDKKTGKKFWMFNLHMDHRGVEARKQSALLVMDRIRTMCGKQPYILLGDFNVNQYNPIYPMMMESGLFQDSYDVAQTRFAPNGSMNHFKSDFYTDSRIDHVLLAPSFTVLDYALLTYVYWTEEESGKYRLRLPSDHYPVGVHVKF